MKKTDGPDGPDMPPDVQVFGVMCLLLGILMGYALAMLNTAVTVSL